MRYAASHLWPTGVQVIHRAERTEWYDAQTRVDVIHS